MIDSCSLRGNYNTELKKILGFYNNESHDFDENILKTQLQIFSKMGLIKTPIRSTMSHERLNHCMIFSTHKE